MKIRSLAQPRTRWREHFLAVAREVQGPQARPIRFPRGGMKPRVRDSASALRSRVLPGASAA